MQGGGTSKYPSSACHHLRADHSSLCLVEVTGLNNRHKNIRCFWVGLGETSLCVNTDALTMLLSSLFCWEMVQIYTAIFRLRPVLLSPKEFSPKGDCFVEPVPLPASTVWNPALWEYKKTPGASLVAQWLRICLPMQGTWVRALVWEDPTYRRATGPVSHNYWACASGACAPQQERPR